MDETRNSRVALRRLEVAPLARQGLRPYQVAVMLDEKYENIRYDFKCLKNGDGNGKRR